MRSRTFLLCGAALASALLLISSPCPAAGWYSTVDVFYGWSVTGTSVTTVNIWEYYDGARPWAEGTLRRDSQYLAWNSRYELYDMQASAQATASLQPGNAFYSMDGLHYAIIDGYQYYLSSSQAGYYYYDPAAQPPYIYGINPNIGVSGTPGYIEIYGSNLAPQGTTPQVSMTGANLWIVYQSDNQINVYYSYVGLGQQSLSVTTIYGTSNYVLFTALTGDPTPSVSGISPEVWPAGTTTDITITGTGFGTNPGLTISGGWIDNYGVYSGWDTGIHGWVTVSPYAPTQPVTVTVTSNGYWGNPFLPQYPNQPNHGSATATLQAAPQPATLSLERSSLTQIWAYGYPTPVGAYSWTLNASSGNAPYLQYAPGVTAQTHPNPVQVVAPPNPDPSGEPTPGGLSQYTARYQAGSGQTSPPKSFKLATFGVSCYMIADEYDWWDGNDCASVTIYGQHYSGITADPPGIQGTFCSAFLGDTKLQGSGVARDGTKIKYNLSTGQYYTVSQFTGADGSLIVADQTIARDRSIIPTGGVHVDLQTIGDGLLANDTGSRITGYRIDLFRGVGRSVCSGWSNPIVVGACSPGNTYCPKRGLE